MTVQGATAVEVARMLKEELMRSGIVRPQEYADAWGKFEAKEIETLGRFEPTVRVVLRKTDDGQADDESTILSRASLGVLTREEGARIFELERRRQSLEAKLAEANKLYKPRHPALVALERELEEVTRDVKAELDFIRKKADAELLMAQKRYDEMMVVSKQLDAAAIAENSRIFEIKAMREDADRIRLLYNTLLGQLLKIDASAGFNTRTVSILEPATLEEKPVYPKKAKGLMMAAAFGLGLGLALAFFIEYIDDSIKLAEEVERELQLPFLGMIPAAQWDPDDLSAHRLDKLKQQGGVSEAYRVVRSAILFSQPRDKLRSILITSAVPREGKTTTAVNIATGFSQVEDRVLLVDADLRRGEVNKYFGLERANGLADILLGEATPEEVVRHTEVPKLDVVTSGSYPSNPAELLLGWRLKEFLEWAYKHYSRVVFDGPPVMGIADSAILGSAVDGVMLVIWAGRTSRRYVRVAKMTAVSRGAKIFGFILNNLEPSRVGYYHYYPYYYSYYSRGYYYAPKEGDKEAGKGGDIKGIEVPTSNDNEKNIDDVY
jgi:capsular exopolysaccharide synthesis family protein